MSSLKNCPKDGLEVDEEFFCSGCVFNKHNPFKGMFFSECDYDKWKPGLKKGKDE